MNFEIKKIIPIQPELPNRKDEGQDKDEKKPLAPVEGDRVEISDEALEKFKQEQK